MISLEEAWQFIENHAASLSSTVVSLEQACGRVLMADARTDLDIPPFSKSLRDGVAFRFGKSLLDEYEVHQTILAGDPMLDASNWLPNQAVRLMTGAALPVGLDTVVMREDVEFTADDESRFRLRSPKPVCPGQWILEKGAVAKLDQPLLQAGTLVQSHQLGILAEAGCHQLNVYRKPRVALLTTGNEVVSHEQKPGPCQIRNSNHPMLRQLIVDTDSELVDLGHCRDEMSKIKQTIESGLESDCLVITGGVSLGDLDLIPPALDQLGVQRVFHQVNLQPGKPIWFGVRDHPEGRCLVFGLPGNPVSSFVCFQLFLKMAIQKRAGQRTYLPEFQQATIANDFAHKGGRTLLLPVQFDSKTGAFSVLNWLGSADQLSLARGNALAKFEGPADYPAGSKVPVLRIV